MSISPEQYRETVLQQCQNPDIGKKLPNALYVHVSALSALNHPLQEYAQLARSVTTQTQEATLVKFNLEQPSLSFLFYPDFDTDPHPPLEASIQVNLETLEVQYRDYSTSDNPPILHRKETFVLPDYPQYETFAQLTRIEEALGLLKNSRFIGTQQEWLQRLSFYSVEFDGHELHQHQERVIEAPFPRIERHKAAIIRKTLSRPVRAALEAELFTPETTFFDYGCGYGGDVERIAAQGYQSTGWDPYYQPNTPLQKAEIVNLGYVINVIEDLAERREALVKAWELSQRLLIVAAQVLIRDQVGQLAYGDGVITRRNTFQKYYEQEELKVYIDQVLEVNSIPVGLGIYFIFRDPQEGDAFRESRFRSRVTTPRVLRKVRTFEEYETMLQPLMAFMTKRGRLPVKGELANQEEILGEFRSYRQAFKLVLEATEAEDWEAIAEQRRQDLKLYLALSNFGGRPSARNLSKPLREDCKALFGSYKKACLFADLMLFSLNDLENIADICAVSPVGQRRKNSFWVHISLLEKLDPLLRLYEGCASRTIGRLETATVIKFHLDQPKISYLSYPRFDKDPHPELHTVMKVELQDLEVHYWETNPDNPPILHEKEKLVSSDYPNYERWVKLTQQEKDRGLLEDRQKICKRRGWLKCLAENCVILKNYQLFWRKDCDRYKLKVLQAAVKTRQRRRNKAAKSKR